MMPVLCIPVTLARLLLSNAPGKEMKGAVSGVHARVDNPNGIIGSLEAPKPAADIEF